MAVTLDSFASLEIKLEDNKAKQIRWTNEETLREIGGRMTTEGDWATRAGLKEDLVALCLSVVEKELKLPHADSRGTETL